jgi:hypothetical protein
MTILSQQDTRLAVACTECGEMLPLPVTVSVVVCDCGAGHQRLDVTPDTFELEHHMVLHEGEDE